MHPSSDSKTVWSEMVLAEEAVESVRKFRANSEAPEAPNYHKKMTDTMSGKPDTVPWDVYRAPLPKVDVTEFLPKARCDVIQAGK